MRLYEIADELRRVAEAEGGELPPDAEQRFDRLNLELADKADSIAALVREREAEARACRVEAERFSDRAASLENDAKRLKLYLQQHLAALGIDRLDTPRFKVYRQQNPLKVEWLGSGDPPREFARVRIEPDLQLVKQALESGKELPEGFRVSRGEHLRIK